MYKSNKVSAYFDILFCFGIAIDLLRPALLIEVELKINVNLSLYQRMNNNSFIKDLLSGDILDDSSELIPIVPPEEEEINNDEEYQDVLPILPVKNTVLFPGVIIPITVGRKKSIDLVKDAYHTDKIIGVLAQRNNKSEDPGLDDAYKVGTVAKIIKMLVLPNGNTTIIIQGRRRFEVGELVGSIPYLKAKINLLKEDKPEIKKKEVKATLRSLKETATKIVNLNPEIPQEAQIALSNIESPSFLIHFLSSNLNVDVKEKQRLLETTEWFAATTILLQLMNKELQLLEFKSEIQSKVHTDIDQQQRDYFVRQQIKVLQDELGSEGPEKEVHDLKEKAAKKKWPEEVEKHFFKEIDKLNRLNPQTPEYPVAMNYLELMVDLPWEKFTKDKFDLKKAQKVLDSDHSGLEKVKERIIEYLAVLKLKNNMKAPILCFYGPPGVGKTSLGRSIAKSLGREYVRLSLGGLHDEAEIRGHRKTYIGAMPGKIIQSIKKAKTSNPVFVLDEIDKVGSNFKGDPSSALLEVLDPEQNSEFMDNYLEIGYDLSKVMFIATANALSTIQPALRDRMELVEITGYSVEEKLEIAKKHLIPELLEDHGMKKKDLTFNAEAIRKVVEGYTRESGVRGLKNQLGSVIRNRAKHIAMETSYEKALKKNHIVDILGTERFDLDLYENNGLAGVATGLAWTSVGGDILFIESQLTKGKGKVTISGQLGDVMKESAMTAMSYLKGMAHELKIDLRIFDQYDLHLHFPEGAVPKDGPSAGITIMTALSSLYTQRRIKPRLAMTGEITLRGVVLPVGGIKEKILAAKRAGIKDVIMCYKNRKDVEEIKDEYIKGLTIHFVKTVEEVLETALLQTKVQSPKTFELKDFKAKKE